MPTKLTCSKVQKTWFFWPLFDPKIGFLRFYPGKLRVITLKPAFLIDPTVKNTSRKVYLESLPYRAENARKSFYYHIPVDLNAFKLIQAVFKLQIF